MFCQETRGFIRVTSAGTHALETLISDLFTALRA